MTLLFEWAFGKKLTPQERLRKNQRALERHSANWPEKPPSYKPKKKLMLEIKEIRQAGPDRQRQDPGERLDPNEGYIVKFNQMKAQLQAILLRIQSVRSNAQMASLMKDATRLLLGMNRLMDLPQLSRIAQEVAKNDLMDQKQEFMDDAIDDAMALDEDGLR